MITSEELERVQGWFTGRLPAEWLQEQPQITLDREEITVVLSIPDVELPGDAPSDSRAQRGTSRPGPRVP